mmetsp:Transcript_22112/g.32305  ORF Transcript_22112/g.32305 Transcript_22112/m.32305 type:complete len:245 (-) Transcript_22112:257-991(-)|eukprot:CAMPEP_0197244168 /NCGR_PEP_ID=MMETSP1429-20130617/9379_1 /TAXON_ID=49237 /ORGANISM="Chaetoceros  sp., Strain UNC1202" /LENGTH=244 /DNA_ID=CAMNT_0042704495 /DNA_START=104 /DNA_END=838 /DNA_ORIENTATION=+
MLSPNYLFTILLLLPVVSSEICNICKNTSHTPQDPGAKFTYSKDGSDLAVNCTFGSELAQQGEFSNCTELQSATEDICKCGDSPPEDHTCNLCGDETLPQPDRMVANQTCQEWEIAANNDFAMDCPSWQKSLGVYCGCDYSPEGFFNGFCRICDDKILPLANKTVSYESGRQDFCALVEQDENSGNGPSNCTLFQNSYRIPCDCDYTFVVPTKAPTAPPSAAANYELSTLLVGLFVGSLVALIG